MRFKLTVSIALESLDLTNVVELAHPVFQFFDTRLEVSQVGHGAH
jgi:hypothetical protein